MARTIKAFVEKQLEFGVSLDAIWDEVAREFPGQIAGWTYMQKIKRDWQKRSPTQQQEG